jgi:hypothetical protein
MTVVEIDIVAPLGGRVARAQRFRIIDGAS